MRRLFLMLLAATAAPAFAAEGVVTARSPHDAKATVAKLTDALKARNFTLVAEVDHAAGASNVGMNLRPTHLVIFGNPRGGTPLMNCAQSFGIDLPLKLLVRQDESGQVFVEYNAPAYLAARHGLGDCGKPALEAMGKALEGIVADATKP